MILKKYGGFIQTWLHAKDDDWTTNGETYRFGPYTDRGFEWGAVKHSDGSVAAHVTGPFGQSFSFTGIARIPPSPGAPAPGRRVNLMIEWKEGVVRLRLNMVGVATAEAVTAPQS
jgi:hypothetical protein